MRLPVLVAAAVAFAAPALAQPSDMTTVTAPHGRSIAVSVGDLDLASAEGQRTLDERLWRAARDVCSFTRLRDLAEYRAEGRCRSAALAHASARHADILAN
jgi:UrcA family protein